MNQVSGALLEVFIDLNNQQTTEYWVLSTECRDFWNSNFVTIGPSRWQVEDQEERGIAGAWLCWVVGGNCWVDLGRAWYGVAVAYWGSGSAEMGEAGGWAASGLGCPLSTTTLERNQE